MSLQNKIHLDTSSILNVPLDSYDEFVFLVNNEEFKTSRIISDLLSPKICKLHISDPTINTFTINTCHSGNFSHILDLVNFKQYDIPSNELPFFIEVIEILENESIKTTDYEQSAALTFDNVFQLIKEHEQYSKFYSKRILTEIDFLSSHLYELPSEKEDELTSLQPDTIEKIFRNPILKIESEDQLISLINRLYKKDESYTTLYEIVIFSCVSDDKFCEFLEIFNYENLTNEIWTSFPKRFQKRRKEEEEEEVQAGRYMPKEGKIIQKQHEEVEILYEKNHEFEGIISYLKKKSNGDIDKLLDITSTQIESNDKFPKRAIDYEDKDSYFSTGRFKDRWICFDFKESKAKLSNYTIRNYNTGPDHPKSWVIEGRNDESSKWEAIDERSNSEEMKGKGIVHTFTVQNSNSKSFRYIRMRSTGVDWDNDNYLCLNAIEFYGIYQN